MSLDIIPDGSAGVLAAAATYYAAIMAAISSVSGTVVDAAAGVADFDTSLTEATNNHYNGMLLMSTSGVTAGQAHLIDVYTGAAKNVAFAASDQWTEAPANGSTFVIIPDSGAYLKKIFTAMALDTTVAKEATITALLLDHLLAAADGTGLYPASIVQDSILAMILSKSDPAVTTSYDHTTDSLEAIADAIVVYRGTLTTSSVSAPADNTAVTGCGTIFPQSGSLDNCFMRITGGTGADALGQIRPIRTYVVTGVSGVFNLDRDFTAAPGTVTYEILAGPSQADRLNQIQGGVSSLQTLSDNDAAELDLARDPQSQSLLMTALEVTAYSQTNTVPWYFVGFSLNLTTMAAGDTIRCRVSAITESGGAYVQLTDDIVNTFAGAQSPALKVYGSLYNVYGVKITMQQTAAGTLRTIPIEIFTAARSS